MANNAVNPYANKDGSPIKGKEFEFFDWAITADEERIAKLPPDQQKKEREAARHLRNKMES